MVATAIEQAAIGLVAGIVFGLYGIWSKKPPDEPINPKKIGRTVVIYGAAGLIVGAGGEPITQGNVAAATASTVVLGEVFDKAYARYTRSQE